MTARIRQAAAAAYDLEKALAQAVEGIKQDMDQELSGKSIPGVRPLGPHIMAVPLSSLQGSWSPFQFDVQAQKDAVMSAVKKETSLEGLRRALERVLGPKGPVLHPVIKNAAQGFLDSLTAPDSTRSAGDRKSDTEKENEDAQ